MYKVNSFGIILISATVKDKLKIIKIILVNKLKVILKKNQIYLNVWIKSIVLQLYPTWTGLLVIRFYGIAALGFGLRQ